MTGNSIMESFFLIIKDVELENGEKQKLKNNSLIEKSIYNYLYFVRSLENISVICIGFNPSQSYEKNLSDLYKCIEENGDLILFQFKYFNESTSCEYFETKNIKNIFELLNKLDKRDISFKVEYLKYIIQNEMSKVFFESVVNPFMHASQKDFVNSDIGLLKIWCNNSKMLPDFKDTIDFGKIQKRLNGFKKAIKDKYKYYEKYYPLIQKILKGEYLFVDRTIQKIEALVDQVSKNEEFDLKELDLEELSKNLFDLFQFISKHHSQNNLG